VIEHVRDLAAEGQIQAVLVYSPEPLSTLISPARARCRFYERYTVAGLSIGAIMRELNDQGVPTRKPTTPWGAADGLGDAAQPRVPRHGVRREDPGGPASARHAPTPDARRDDHAE
jgi:hypothetical protein